MTTIPLGVTVVAEGEIRNAAGEVVDRTRDVHTETVAVDLDDLRTAVQRRNLTDDQLREIGLDDTTITQIRSTPL